jgi:hypothetical protein
MIIPSTHVDGDSVKLTYLHEQFRKLDNDALEIVMCSMYGCQRTAFEILHERGEMFRVFPRDESNPSTNSGPIHVHNVEAYIRKPNT